MTKQQHNKSEEGSDMLFYSIITALGIGLTSLCVYGFRKYKEYNEEEYVEEVYEFYTSQDFLSGSDTDDDTPAPAAVVWSADSPATAAGSRARRRGTGNRSRRPG